MTQYRVLASEGRQRYIYTKTPKNIKEKRSMAHTPNFLHERQEGGVIGSQAQVAGQRCREWSLLESANHMGLTLFSKASVVYDLIGFQIK